MPDSEQKKFNGPFADFLESMGMSPMDWVRATGATKTSVYRRLGNNDWKPGKEWAWFMSELSRLRALAQEQGDELSLLRKAFTQQAMLNVLEKEKIFPRDNEMRDKALILHPDFVARSGKRKEIEAKIKEFQENMMILIESMGSDLPEEFDA